MAKGESIGDLEGIAQIRVPSGYVFADGDETRIIMEAMENLTSGSEMGFVAPSSLDWFVVFEFDETGYVPDDEKDSLDADAMLRSMKQSDKQSNEERQRRGWPALYTLGWEQEPTYNGITNNLEWAIRLESEGNLGINHNTRLLGRRGVMQAPLVADPEEFSLILHDFRSLLAGYEFQAGHRYAEFREGDKIAEYGLTALVVGGAAAVAAKTGLLSKIWKFLFAGVLVLAAFFKKLFSGRKSQRTSAPFERNGK